MLDTQTFRLHATILAMVIVLIKLGSDSHYFFNNCACTAQGGFFRQYNDICKMDDPLPQGHHWSPCENGFRSILDETNTSLEGTRCRCPVELIQWFNNIGYGRTCTLDNNCMSLLFTIVCGFLMTSIVLSVHTNVARGILLFFSILELAENYHVKFRIAKTTFAVAAAVFFGENVFRSMATLGSRLRTFLPDYARRLTSPERQYVYLKPTNIGRPKKPSRTSDGKFAPTTPPSNNLS
jgi:hypothetical protein